MRLVYQWLNELVAVSEPPERLAADLALRGFEVASIEHGRQPVIDFEITANRPDCLSHIGLAREVSAAYGRPLRTPELPVRVAPSALAQGTLPVRDAACHERAGRVRDAACHERAAQRRVEWWRGKDSNLRRRWADRFTVCCV